jgi:hypothetical protein
LDFDLAGYVGLATRLNSAASSCSDSGSREGHGRLRSAGHLLYAGGELWPICTVRIDAREHGERLFVAVRLDLSEREACELVGSGYQ